MPEPENTADHISRSDNKTAGTVLDDTSPNEKPTTAPSSETMENGVPTSETELWDPKGSVGTEQVSAVVEVVDPVDTDEVEAQQDEQEEKSTVTLQIRDLREKLRKLEEQATPRARAQAVKAEWERDIHRYGPRGELERWKEKRKQMHTSLLADSIAYAEGRKWIDNVAEEAEERMKDELKYGERILRLRKNWAKRRGHLEPGLSNPDSSGTSDDSDLERGFHMQERHLRDQYEFDRRVLRAEWEVRQDQRERRERRRRLRQAERYQRQHERENQSEAESSKDEADQPEDGTPLAPVIPSAISRLNRIPWADFRILHTASEKDSSAIDILIGEPDIDLDDKGHARWPKPVEKRPAASHQPTARESPLAERIRIHSRQIIAIFGEIRSSDPQFQVADGTVTLIRPFKSLVFHMEELRASHEKLRLKFTQADRHDETKVDDMPESSAKVGMQTTETQTAPEAQDKRDDGEEQQREEAEAEAEGDTNSRVAYDHMKCLMKFLDNDIAERNKYLDGPGCKKVFFWDLWYLFQPGQYVIQNDGKQAYRILSVRTPPHRAADPWPYWTRQRAAMEEEKEDMPMVIKCVYIDFDGKQLGPVSKQFSIKSFDGERLVTSLAVYPLRFHPQPETTAEKPLWDSLIDRGRQFLKVSAVHLGKIQPMYYAGPALGTGDEVESQVIVDFEATFTADGSGEQQPVKSGDEQQLPSSGTEADGTKMGRRNWRPKLETLLGGDAEDEAKPDACKAACCYKENVHDESDVDKKRNEAFENELRDQATRDQERHPPAMLLPRALDLNNPEAGLKDGDLVIMCYRVFGFILRSRKWAQLDLTYLTEAKATQEKNVKPAAAKGTVEETALEKDLVLPKGHSKMILSLISQHFRDKGKTQIRTDIVRGKGKGLILLLHGPPGVGKTTTAECVADIFQKPLFQLTCGDLGTTANQVESTLETNFALASRWGCVLLLDEADVFLAQRTKEDFQRNGLVAVFLRVLEYYAGVLFLTTNRVGDFDEAFASRIHISLYYPDLGRKETLEVLKRNLGLLKSRFPADGPQTINIEGLDIGDYVGSYFDKNPFDHWNGRQIRNACQTALALAEFDARGKENDGSSPNPSEVRLERKHFEMVGEAYLEFSRYVQNLYGTNSARRAKEAGLRAMWVDSKGRPVGSLGPKDKLDRHTRYRLKGHGRYWEEVGNQQHTRAPAGSQEVRPSAQQPQGYAPSGYAPPFNAPQQQATGRQGQTYDYHPEKQPAYSYTEQAPQRQVPVHDPYYGPPRYPEDAQYQQQHHQQQQRPQQRLERTGGYESGHIQRPEGPDGGAPHGYSQAPPAGR